MVGTCWRKPGPGPSLPLRSFLTAKPRPLSPQPLQLPSSPLPPQHPPAVRQRTLARAEGKPLLILAPLPAGPPVSLRRQFDSLWDLLVSCPGVGLTRSWSCSFELSRPLFATTTLWDTEIGLCGGPGGAGLGSAPPSWGARETERPNATWAGKSHSGPPREIPLLLVLGPSFYPDSWAFR